MPLRRLASIALLCLATGAQAAPPLLPLPADWYPESVAVGPDGSFYVGSWRQGAVARLKAGSPPAVLVKPGSNGLANTQGVLVDAKRGTLWVCSGNIGFTLVPPTPSALKRYDLATGAARGSYTMPDAGYCNDLAQDTRGNIYVTDSLHPRVLRLPPGADALMPWKDDALLAGPAPYGDFKGLNGIAFDGDRHLVVSLVAAASHVLRIDIDTQGRAGTVTRIEAPRELKNVDAIRAWKPGRLVFFESNAFGKSPYGGQVTVARLEGERMALRTVVAGLNDPSSGVVIGNRVWFIESKYSLLTAHPDDDAAIPRGVPFDVQSAELQEPE